MSAGPAPSLRAFSIGTGVVSTRLGPPWGYGSAGLIVAPGKALLASTYTLVLIDL